MHQYKHPTNLLIRIDTDIGPVVLKHFGWRSPIHFYLSPAFHGRAATSWRIARRLQSLGARTPEPLYLYSRRARGFIYENFFITAAIHPHQSLRNFLLDAAIIDDHKLMVIADLAVSIARMHNGGIIHNDLTTANFLVDDQEQVHIIDLNRAKVYRRPSLTMLCADLARLNFESTDGRLDNVIREKFFEVYGEEMGGGHRWVDAYIAARAKLIRARKNKTRLRNTLRRKKA